MKLANSAKYLLVCDCLTSPARRPVKSPTVFLTEHHLSSPWTVSPLQETHRKDMVLINGTSVSDQSILAIIATHRQSNPCETPDYRQLVLQAEVRILQTSYSTTSGPALRTHLLPHWAPLGPSCHQVVMLLKRTDYACGGASPPNSWRYEVARGRFLPLILKNGTVSFMRNRVSLVDASKLPTSVSNQPDPEPPKTLSPARPPKHFINRSLSSCASSTMVTDRMPLYYAHSRHTSVFLRRHQQRTWWMC